jgi:hypothetical protein
VSGRRIDRSADGSMLLEWRSHPLTNRQELRDQRLELEPVLIQDPGAVQPLVDYRDDGFHLSWNWKGPWTSIRFRTGKQEQRIGRPAAEVSWRPLGDVVEATPLDQSGNPGATQLLHRRVIRPKLLVQLTQRLTLDFQAQGVPAEGTLCVRWYPLRDQRYAAGEQHTFRLRDQEWFVSVERNRAFIGMIAIVWEREGRQLLLDAYKASRDHIVKAAAADLEPLRSFIEGPPPRYSHSFVDAWPELTRDRLRRMSKLLAAEIVSSWPNRLTGAYRAALLSFYGRRDALGLVHQLDSGDFVNALAIFLFGKDPSGIQAKSIVQAIQNRNLPEARKAIDRAKELREKLRSDSPLAKDVQAAADAILRHMVGEQSLDLPAVSNQIDQWVALIADESYHPDGPPPEGREAHERWEGERIARRKWLTELTSLLSLWIDGEESAPPQTDLLPDLLRHADELLRQVSPPPAPVDDSATVEHDLDRRAGQLLATLDQHDTWLDALSLAAKRSLSTTIVPHSLSFARLLAEIKQAACIREEWPWLRAHMTPEGLSSLEMRARWAHQILELDQQRESAREQLAGVSAFAATQIMDIVSTPHHPAVEDKIREIDARLQSLDDGTPFPPLPQPCQMDMPVLQLTAWWGRLRELIAALTNRTYAVKRRLTALEEQRRQLVPIADRILSRVHGSETPVSSVTDLQSARRLVDEGELQAVVKIQRLLNANWDEWQQFLV